MRLLLAVAAKDLRQRIRDRSAIIVAFVAPVVLATIISLALGDAFTGSFHATYAVADLDGGPLGRAFVQDVLGDSRVSEIADIRSVASAEEARSLVEDERVDAAFVLPAGLSRAVASGGSASVRVLAGGEPVAADVAESLAAAFAVRVNEARLATAVARVAGVAEPPSPDGGTTAPSVVVGAPEGEELDPASYFGPAMALFFLFFAVGLGVRTVLAERAQRTLPRLLAAPVPAAVVLAGKALAAFSLGLVSVLVVLAVSSAVLGAGWGSVPAVLALVGAMTLVATALVWVIATFARTEEQAGLYASLAAIGLSLLGGNFFPIGQAPELLRRIALLTPNGQALRGFADLAVEADPGLGSVAQPVLVIAGFAVALGAVAVGRSRTLVLR